MDRDVLTDDDIATLERLLVKLSGQSAELPWPLFRFINEVVATVNVDLLVIGEDNAVLLAWRDDPFGTGWHVPGSIIRHREEIPHRISACAGDEFGCAVDVDPNAVALLQIFDDRGHSVSICHRAALRGTPGRPVRHGGETPAIGDLRWFGELPDDLYPSHLAYRDIVAALRRGELAAGIPLFTQHVGFRDAASSAPSGTIGANAKLV